MDEEDEEEEEDDEDEDEDDDDEELISEDRFTGEKFELEPDIVVVVVVVDGLMIREAILFGVLV